MTKTEAIGLEAICEKYFDDVFDGPTISMSLNGKLRVGCQGIYFTFDHNTGELVWVHFDGFFDELTEIQKTVKEVCEDPKKKKNLDLLAWSYKHIHELTD